MSHKKLPPEMKKTPRPASEYRDPFIGQAIFLTRYFKLAGAEGGTIMPIRRLAELISQERGEIPPYGGKNVLKQYITDFYYRIHGRPRGWDVVRVLPKAKRMPDHVIKSAAFYETPEWKALRYEALKKYGARCHCCGNTRKNNVAIQVDHIKPRSLYPELALDISNTQILCGLCNHAKSNTDQTDWR